MRCPICGHENSTDANTCEKCGVNILAHCQDCGYEVVEQAKFCHECGATLSVAGLNPAKPAQLRGSVPSSLVEQMLATGKGVRSERKYVTILFADITGFTPMAEQLDAEEVVGIINRYYEVVTEVIFRYGGTIERYTGDGIMVLFGAPVTHENDCERAILAALDLMASVQSYNATSQFPLEIHVGIDSGWVVAGYIGSRWRMQYTAVGDTVNRTARIQGAAKSGHILVGESSYAQTKHLFEYLEEGIFALKGKSQPVKVFRPLSAHPAQSTHGRLNHQKRRFVGRTSELVILRELFTQVMQGHGQALGVSGDAGVGKSRLLSEFFHKPPAEIRFLLGQCLPYEGVSTYFPLITVVRRYLASLGENGKDIREAFANDLIALKQYLPSFEDLLFMTPSQPDYQKLSPQVRRKMIFEALTALFRHLAVVRPLILVIEDVQWIDHTSQEFITQFLDVLDGQRIFVVLTFRPDYHAPWSGHPAYTALSVTTLCEEDGQDLVQTLFDAPVSQDLARYILGRTEGNPFFAEELIRALQENGLLKRNGHYSLASPEAPTIPQTIHGVLAARMDRLDNETKNTLQVASVIGQEFAVPILLKVRGIGTPVEEQLAVLSDSGFLYRQHDDGSMYTFKHALTLEVAYHTLLRSRRQDLHRDVADAITALLPDIVVTRPEVLAHHFTEARQPNRAIPHWLKAGQKSIQRSAHVEATAHLNKGLQLLDLLPDDPGRAEAELDLRVTLGPALMAIKGPGATEVEHTYSRARDLCRRVGETPRLFPVLFGLWRFYLLRADLTLSRELSDGLLTLAQQDRHPEFLLEAHLASGASLFWTGEIARSQERLAYGIAVYDSDQHESHAYIYGQNPLVVCLCYMAFGLWVLGCPDRAVAKIQEAVARAKELSHPFTLAYALFGAAMIHHLRREPADVQQYAEAGMDLSAKHGFPYFSATCAILNGWALAEQDRAQEAISKARRAFSTWLTTESKVNGTYLLSVMAEIFAKGAEATEGLDLLKQALALARDTGEVWWEPELYRLMGRMQLIQCESEIGIEELFSKAWETAYRRGAKMLELRAAVNLSRVWHERGEHKKAHKILAESYGAFIEGFDILDLRDAQRFCAEYYADLQHGP